MMGPRWRRFALTLHLSVSVGWVGAVLAYLALDVTTATSQDATAIRSAYLAMDRITSYVIVPLALAALATGVWLAAGTKWGLFRHYWVMFSLVLTALAVIVLLVEAMTISELAKQAADPTVPDEAIRGLPSTLPHSVGGLVVLMVVMVLNVYKPRGLTRYGWRKQAMDRAADGA